MWTVRLERNSWTRRRSNLSSFWETMRHKQKAHQISNHHQILHESWIHRKPLILLSSSVSVSIEVLRDPNKKIKKERTTNLVSNSIRQGSIIRCIVHLFRLWYLSTCKSWRIVHPIHAVPFRRNSRFVLLILRARRRRRRLCLHTWRHCFQRRKQYVLIIHDIQKIRKS